MAVEIEQFQSITGRGVVAGHAPLPGRPETSRQPRLSPNDQGQVLQVRFWVVEAPKAARSGWVVCFACGATWDGTWTTEGDLLVPQLRGSGKAWAAWGDERMPCTCSYGLTKFSGHVHAGDHQIRTALQLDLELTRQEEIRF